MTQTHTPASPLSPAIAWRQALQRKLMAALDAAWAMIENSNDPAVLRAARDRAKAIGDIATMGRKVVLFDPGPSEKPARAKAPGLVEALTSALEPVSAPVAVPMAAQAEHARRALDKLKGRRRGRP